MLELEAVFGNLGAGRLRASASGKLLVTYDEEAIPRIAAFGRLARVYLEGVLQERPDGSLIFRARGVHVLEAAPPLEAFRTKLRLQLAAFLGEWDWGGLALALLVGSRDLLDTDLAAAFRRAGCSHVLALSGMHLAVISALIAMALRRPLGRKWATVAGAVLISGYVYLAGGQPSLVRAMLMYHLGGAGLLLGRRSGGLPLLSLAFIIQLTLNPAEAQSASFILSYIALAGILCLAEPIDYLLRCLLPPGLSQGVAASLGAFLAAAAVSALLFGELYPVGLAASLVLTPLATWFMIAAMAGPLLMALVPPLAPLIGLLLSLHYRFIGASASFFAQAPSLSAHPLPALLLSAAASAGLLYAAASLRRRLLRVEPFYLGRRRI
jgi:competence protein ComEC